MPIAGPLIACTFAMLPQGLLNSLKRQLEQQHRQSNDLETVAKSIITSVFAVRFRDTWAEVRATVIHSFAHWIDMAPEAYLADAHLKYLGWALSDPDPAVRLEAVSGVSQLYKGKENVLGLHDFTVRFLARFREMIRDKDEVVSEHVLGLLARLVEVGELDQVSHGMRSLAYCTTGTCMYALLHISYLRSCLGVQVGGSSMTFRMDEICSSIHPACTSGNHP